MKKPQIIMTITKEDIGYSGHAKIQNVSINTQGDDMDELKTNIIDAVNLSFEAKGFIYALDEITLKPDLASFFEFYKVINAKALSQRIGMNQSLLAQYINGIKKPSAAQTQRILQGVQQVGKELAAIQFLG